MRTRAHKLPAPLRGAIATLPAMAHTATCGVAPRHPHTIEPPKEPRCPQRCFKLPATIAGELSFAPQVAGG